MHHAAGARGHAAAYGRGVAGVRRRRSGIAAERADRTRCRNLARAVAKDKLAVGEGELVVLENCRFNKGEKKNAEDLSKKYAALCDGISIDLRFIYYLGAKVRLFGDK